MDAAYDHYKETCGLVRDNIKIRNRFFMFLCIELTILMLFMTNSDGAILLLTSWAHAQFGLMLSFGVNVIQSLLWVILLYLLIRYIQANIYIERQYLYIGRLEKSIKKNFFIKEAVSFDREGKSYLRNYPVVQNVIAWTYAWFFPIVFAIGVFVKVFIEWCSRDGMSFWTILDSIVALVAVLLIVLYCVFRYDIDKEYK